MAVKSDPMESPRVEQEVTLVSWVAKSRPFRKSEVQSRQAILVLGGLVVMVLAFAGEWMLLVVLAAAAFYYYATSHVPPENVEYSITNKGIRAYDRLYLWWEFSRWWWTEKYGSKLISLELTTGVTGRLFIPIDMEKESVIEKIMNDNVLYEVPKETTVDKMAKWAVEKFPLENKI